MRLLGCFVHPLEFRENKGKDTAGNQGAWALKAGFYLVTAARMLSRKQAASVRPSIKWLVFITML